MQKTTLFVAFAFFSTNAMAMTQEKAIVLWAIHEVSLHPHAPSWLPQALSPKIFETKLIDTIKKSSYFNKAAASHAGSLPTLMKAWLLDLEQEQKLTACARENISMIWDLLLYKIAAVAFSPKEAASHLQPNQDVIKLIQACQQNGHKTVLASNWNSASFIEIEKQHAALVELFKHRFISGKVGNLTSEPAFFEAVKANRGDNKPYYYIDAADAKESLAAARKAGITTIEYTTPEGLKLQLVNLKLLPA